MQLTAALLPKQVPTQKLDVDKEGFWKQKDYPVTTFLFLWLSRLYCERHAFFPDQQILKEGEAMKTDNGPSPMMSRYQASTSCGALCPCQAGDKCYIFNLGPARLSRDGRAATGCEAFAPSCCPQRPCCRKRALQSLCSTERGLHAMGCSCRQVHIGCVQAALCWVATQA